MRKRPVALIILDGFGDNPCRDGNAICAAHTPFIAGVFKKYPAAELETSGRSVGLPDGQMGSSEVGHLNIGAGRIVYQDTLRITRAIEEGSLTQNAVVMNAFNRCAGTDQSLHVMGLVSPGGVHSHTDHLYGLIKLARQVGVNRVFIHAFLDGRDVPPQSALGFIRELEKVCSETGIGQIATVMGRYYAMDRDKRWDRVEKAYRAMVAGEGLKAVSAEQAVKQSYSNGTFDEFVVPTVIHSNGEPVGLIRPGDSVLFFNFRPDRAREITRAFVDRHFDAFERPGGLLGVSYVCLTQYDETIDAPVAFPPMGRMPDILAQVLSDAGLKQLHIAETEKYAHVTFFFNGGEETPFPGEDRILVPSPKVATYDELPEMSAPGVTEKVLQAIEAGDSDVIIMNYANCDMVGHTGSMEAAVKAVEAVDRGLAEVIPALLAKGGAALITADHGNAEQMIDYETNQPLTAHTTNPVPIIMAGGPSGTRLRNGILADVAPTLLELIGLPQPAAMTGKNLIEKT